MFISSCKNIHSLTSKIKLLKNYNLSFPKRTFISVSRKHIVQDDNVNSFQSGRRKLHQCIGFTQKYTENESPYNGMYLTIKNEDQNETEFDHLVNGLLARYRKEKRRSVFLQVPINQSHLIRVASKYGFIYHHARNCTSVLSLWLDDKKESKLPLYANHRVGVAGACYDEDSDQLLVVKDKGRYSKWWKFPGGLSEKDEFIGDVAVRETFEETGIRTEFRSMLSVRQQHDVIFDQSDFYFICRLNPLSYDINPCADEIEQCEWMTITSLLEMDHATPFVKLICRLLKQGKRNGYRNIDIVGTEMESWVTQNKKYMIYHRPEIM